MKYFALIILLLINFRSQENNKLRGSYYCIVENEYYHIQKNKITFTNNTFTFDDKLKSKGKIFYGNTILLENFISEDLTISIDQNQIKKDTIQFYIYNRKTPVMDYLAITVGKGKFIKIK